MVAASTPTSLTLRDGRTLAYAVTGPETGVPLLFHHGTPGCLHQPGSMRQECERRGLRLLTYTRAGAQGSDRHPGRSIADNAADMADLLDAIGADRALVIGKSGGGPHALATAALLPERVVAVASVAGVMPSVVGGTEHTNFLEGMGEDNLEEFGLARQGEEALRPWLESMAQGLRTSDGAAMAEHMHTLLPPVDAAVLRDPQVGVDTVAGLRGGAQRVDGWLDDDLAFVRDWGFGLGSLSVPSVVWQGSEDLMVPFHHGEWLAAHLPGATAHLLPGEGHLSITVGRLGEVIDELLAHL